MPVLRDALKFSRIARGIHARAERFFSTPFGILRKQTSLCAQTPVPPLARAVLKGIVGCRKLKRSEAL